MVFLVDDSSTGDLAGMRSYDLQRHQTVINTSNDPDPHFLNTP